MKSRIGSIKARALATFALSLGGAALATACSSAPGAELPGESSETGETEQTGATGEALTTCTSNATQICHMVKEYCWDCCVMVGRIPKCGIEVSQCQCADRAPPTPPAPTQIAAGGSTTFARKDDGTVWGWGFGDNLSKALAGAATTSKPTQIAGITGAAQVTAGDSGGCARTGDGHVLCWGLAVTDPSPVAWSTKPVVDASTAQLTGMDGIAQGGAHACAWKAGQVYCWGDGTSGQLGDGLGTSREYAAVVPGLSGVTSVAMGQNTTCVLAGGKVSCFGDNSFGQCGTGSHDGNFRTPSEVRAIWNVTKLYGGGYGTFCADGTAADGLGTFCWGVNNLGQVGHGDANPASTPVRVTFGPGHALGPLVSCAFTPGSTGSCWGNNVNGELSSSGATDSLTPIVMTAATSVTQIAIGDAHMCVLTGTTVCCWGDDTYGQIGDGKVLVPGKHAVAVDVAF
jgi:alpha-tubulin suppressor-like RCC1 family protein